MAIEVPVSGQVISAEWGKSVADQINKLVSILDALEPQRYSASGSLGLTANWQDVPGTTINITPPELENWLVTAVFNFQFDQAGSPGSYGMGVICLDGVIQAGTAQTPAGDGGRSTATMVTTLFPSPSGKAFQLKLQAATSGSVAGALIQGTHTRMLVQRLPRSIAPLSDAILKEIADANNGAFDNG